MAHVPVAVLSASHRGLTFAELKNRFAGEVEVAQDLDGVDARAFEIID